MKDLDNVLRTIYMWRRYNGKRVPNGKCYSFKDIDKLEQLLTDYFKNKNKKKFNWDFGQVEDWTSREGEM